MTDENDAIDNFMAASSGYLLSRWLPYGAMRKAIFFLLLFIFSVGVMSYLRWYHIASLVAALSMSPRIVGEAAYFFGRIMGTLSRIFRR